MELKIARLRKGLTQSQLAKLCYIDDGTLCAYETGRYIPKVDVAIRIADALGVQDLREIFSTYGGKT